MSVLKPFAGGIMLLLLATLLTACKREHPYEERWESNKPPVATAGPDQIIPLLTDSAVLDGSASIDSDGTVASYRWAKIAGPDSPNIINPDSSKTVVKTLAAGVYQFELTVTDNGGLSTKDTVLVMVDSQLPASLACDNSNRPQINARLVFVGKLSKPRLGMAVASAGNKIVFAGGNAPDCPECWGSSRVDIYDMSTRTWSTAELSVPRWGLVAVAAGHKIFFAGGENGDGAFDTYYANVDIYDASTNTWSVASLSQPRSKIAAATVGDKVLFAGGEIPHDYNTSSTVDIYNLSTNSWSTAQLSEKRAHLSAVSVNNKIYFAGGHVEDRWYRNPSNRIDVYDNTTNSWATSSLSEPMGFLAGTTLAGKIYWASGCKLEIKNAITGNDSSAYLSSSLGMWVGDQNAVIKDNKIVFLRMEGNKFDIHDVATNAWSIGALPPNSIYGATAIAVNNTIYLAGGTTVNNFFSPSDQVWKLEF